LANGNRRERVRSLAMFACAVRSRSIGVICAAFLLAACGGAQPQDAQEPSHSFKVSVTTASFPSAQRLSAHTHLVLAIRNDSGQAIPDIAVTICNVTCAYPAPPGEGTSAAAFGQNLQMTGLAHPSRPVWVVDRPPGACNAGCQANSSSGGGGPGGAVTAYANTWSLGRLPAGHTATFDWSVTAVAPGHHVVAWEVAAGLAGKAKAVLADGSLPHGTFAVDVSTAPSETYVNNNGQIVTAPANNP
jgi:hypothetical protein